jgi:hypothetical protein
MESGIENQESRKDGIGKYMFPDSRFLLFLILLLTACAQPITAPTRATQAEIAAEERTQEEFVKDTYAAGYVHGAAGNPVSPSKRLQAVAPKVVQATVALCREMKWREDARDCGYDVSLKRIYEGGNALNAYADGKSIYITSAMVRFTQNDDELASILAHEAAHNLMEHIDGLQQNMWVGMLAGLAADAAIASAGGGSGGNFTKLGAEVGQVAYSPDFEIEADYVGMYITARAGYRVAAVPTLWRRLSLANTDSIYGSTTHPSNPERFVLMQKTVAEIHGKQARREPLQPHFQAGKKPLTPKPVQSLRPERRR